MKVNRFILWLRKIKPSKRKIIQLYAALLHNANLKGFISGKIFKGDSKVLCAPGLNCYSCPGAVGACPLGTLQNSLSSANKRLPFYVFGILMLYGLILGRTICGFLCPMGLLQELVYKIKTPKINKSNITRTLSYFKYVLLAVLVFIIPVIYGFYDVVIPGFCKYVCPAGIVEGAFGLLSNPNNVDFFQMLGGLFTWKFFLLIAIAVMCVFMYRFFCRFLCPLGAIYGFFNKFSFLGIKVNNDKCTNCGLCIKACKMDVKKVGDHECINCGECISVCHTNAITWKGGKLFLHENQVDVPCKTTNINIQNNNKVKEVLTNELDEEKIPEIKKRKTAVGITSILLYPFGVDKFLMGSKKGGKKAILWTILSIIFSPIGCVFLTIRSIKGIIKGIKVLIMNDNEFEDYVKKVNTFLVYEYIKEDNKPKTKKWFKITSISVASSLLVGVLIYANFFNKDSNPITTGNEIGEKCLDTNLSIYGKDEKFTVSSHVGKIVIINFWATYCGPCVLEIPHFEDIQKEYQDDVYVVAIHHKDTTEDVEKFINKKAWNEYSIDFAQDEESTNYYEALGGKGTLPMTVIVDQEGIISNKYLSSITYESLKTDVDNLLK